jgi:hypothetical protein
MVEIWSRLIGDSIAFAVRADTDRWVAVLFKDFLHHGMIGDFNDAKLLTTEGIGDYFVAARPEQRQPGPRHSSGVHT